jgi:hypothetical protein
MRKSDDALVLGFLQTEMGKEALAAGHRDAAEEAFRTALSLDRRVFPAHLSLADLWLERDPRRAAQVLEDAIAAVPERAYRRQRAAARYAACGNRRASWRFAAAVGRTAARAASGSRASCAEEAARGALGCCCARSRRARAAGAPQCGARCAPLAQLGPEEQKYGDGRESALYVDPHICTACRYRADDMLWRCPHCHEWNTLVEERVGPAAGTR